MILKYALSDDTADLDTITVEGNTVTQMLTVKVINDGVECPVNLTFVEARELAAEIVNIAVRLDPPMGGIQLDGALKRSAIQPCGTTGF